MKEKEIEKTELDYSTKEILEVLWVLLSASKLPDDMPIIDLCEEDELLRKIVSALFDLRELCITLSRGELDKLVYSKGYILSGLKSLQSNLRHLTWQTRKVAEGDFSQKVDFLGEFSESFNEMTAKLQKYEEQLKSQANYDQLTHLSNRYFLMQFLSTHFDKFRRDHDVFSVLLLDIDHFKAVNDTYGHGDGDKVLFQVSEILRSAFRSSDVLSRYGGEEFLIVLLSTDVQIAQVIAERVRRTIQETKFRISDNIIINITVSIGVSQAEASDERFEAIIKRSDDALYMAKNNGRNQVMIR